jgi:hypothetical protein
MQIVLSHAPRPSSCPPGWRRLWTMVDGRIVLPSGALALAFTRRLEPVHARWQRKGAAPDSSHTELDPAIFARASRLTAVSMDMTGGYAKSVRDHAPHATIVIDNYHVVQLATKALDEVRREHWNELGRAGEADAARGDGAQRAPGPAGGRGPVPRVRWELLRLTSRLGPGRRACRETRCTRREPAHKRQPGLGAQ